MARLLKKDVELILDSVNRNIPKSSRTLRTIYKEFKADYAPQYGGWVIIYYDGSARVRYPLGQLRVSTSEAYRFFEGVLFSIKSL